MTSTRTHLPRDVEAAVETSEQNSRRAASPAETGTGTGDAAALYSILNVAGQQLAI